jgi:monofunctional biosynthetic peptidoglycan transglycosylase
MLKTFKYVILIALALFGLRMLKIAFWDMPALRWHNPTSTRLMRIRGDQEIQSWVPLNRISSNLKKAVIAAEDGRFYVHNGVDFYEMKQAFKKNMKAGRFARGGSTITMQLVKNLYFSPTKSLVRKVFEIPLAFKIEKDLSKDRILEIYLNVIEWGNGIYGAEAASQHYFNKSASNLTNSEAAFLAAIIPNPRKWGSWPPSARIKKRMNLVARLAGSPDVGREDRIGEGEEKPASIGATAVKPNAPEEATPDDFFVDDLDDGSTK